MGIKKICLNCYKEYKNGETQCSYCGFSKDKYERQPSCMDIESELCNGRYLVGQLIDESDTKKIYMGWDTAMKKKIFIQEYFPLRTVKRNSDKTAVELKNAGDEALFENEKSLYKKLLSNVAQISIAAKGLEKIEDFFEENNTIYIVIAYQKGVRLNEFIEQYGVMPADKMKTGFKNMMYSLEKLHVSGMTHANIVPENIFVCRNGEIWLLNFGITGKADIKKDIVDLGKSVFFGLTGSNTCDYSKLPSDMDQKTIDAVKACLNGNSLYETYIKSFGKDDDIEYAHNYKRVIKHEDYEVVNVSEETVQIATNEKKEKNEEAELNKEKTSEIANNSQNADNPEDKKIDESDGADILADSDALVGLSDLDESDALDEIDDLDDLKEENTNSSSKIKIPKIKRKTKKIKPIKRKQEPVVENDGEDELLDEDGDESMEESLSEKKHFELPDIPYKKIVIAIIIVGGLLIGGSYMHYAAPTIGQHKDKQEKAVEKEATAVPKKSAIPQYVVPNVAGKTKYEAENKLTEAFQITVTEVYDETIPAGIVIKQSILPGETVSLQNNQKANISLVVSKGVKPDTRILVPNVTGLNKQNAVEKLKKVGLKVEVKYAYNDNVSNGKIVSQSPDSDTKIEKNDIVTIYVSKEKKATPKPYVNNSNNDNNHNNNKNNANKSQNSSNKNIKQRDPFAGNTDPFN